MMNSMVGEILLDGVPRQPATPTAGVVPPTSFQSLLRHNAPAAGLWYSRDVQAIAKARGLERVAPYFIDADRADGASAAADAPAGGLTVTSFHNNHLLYAITWYTLALMIPVAIELARRGER
jgi:surfeit locus 1 family protein